MPRDFIMTFIKNVAVVSFFLICSISAEAGVNADKKAAFDKLSNEMKKLEPANGDQASESSMKELAFKVLASCGKNRQIVKPLDFRLIDVIHGEYDVVKGQVFYVSDLHDSFLGSGSKDLYKASLDIEFSLRRTRSGDFSLDYNCDYGSGLAMICVEFTV